MGTFRLLAAFLAVALSFSAYAAQPEVVFIGRVENVIALPKGHARCQVPCQPGRVCISNSCGCAEASVVPVEPVVGPLPDSSQVVAQKLDEWCRLPSPPGAELLVQRLPSGEVRSSLLGAAAREFDAATFSVVGGVDVSTLPSQDGVVPLAELRRRLGL